MYKCRNCNKTFSEDEIQTISLGHDVYYVGDGRYTQEHLADVCPHCYSEHYDEYDPDEFEE
jgi:Zn finger protein HypA/HybF involved in hydrogenase expression